MDVGLLIGVITALLGVIIGLVVAIPFVVVAFIKQLRDE